MTGPGDGGRPDVSVIIVAYRSEADLPDCLDSIAPAAGEVAHELIVVDNASPDASAEVARAHRPDAVVLDEETNHGFGRAVNLASRHARGRYLLLVNPDARLHPGTIDALVTFADEHPGHGFYGGRVLTPSGELDPKSCWGLPSAWSAFCYATGLSSAFRRSRLFDPTSLGPWERDDVREVGAVSGCLLLVSTEAWATVGGFEETYFLYGEDIDLGWKAHAAGYRPVITPTATLTHAVGGSTGDPVRRTEWLLIARSTYFRLRWSPLASRWGLATLVAGVGLRMAGERLRARLGRPSSQPRWTELWARRGEWLAGFPDREPLPDGRPIDHRPAA